MLSGYPIYPPGTTAVIPPRDVSDLGQTGQSAALPVAPFPPSETFFLHSKPGSAKIIFLDFDGHTLQNSVWNDPDTMKVGDEIPTIIIPPYSTDNDGTFSNMELLNIQEIWERVSEDFRPFDVDVTTEDPGGDKALAGKGIRVCIGGSNDVWLGQNVGGIALINSFGDKTGGPCFVFEENVANGDPKSVAEATSHEVGHTVGLYHDGLVVLGQQNPTEYYPGHGPGLGFPTGWAPIMGVGYDQELTQWSKGEYPNAVTMWPAKDPPEPRLDLQDDLKDISAKLPYRMDDHGNDKASATELDFTGTSFFGEGNIEKNTDLDFFAFTIGVEEVVFDIKPFHIGPNLDILATLYDSAGNVLATSNPRDALDAGFTINTLGSTLQLTPGVYYISIDGTGKVFTTDPGYTDYGSLGYFSISGTRKSLLDILIGVDFDVPGGSKPANWTQYTGGGPAVFSDVINELGATTPYNLSISSSSGTLASHTNTLNVNSVPFHTQPLAGLGGFVAGSGETWTFTWSDLEPLTVYEVYVFGANDSAGANHVEIVGNTTPISFTQSLSTNDLAINGQTGSRTRPLIEYARTIQSTAAGTIKITVTTEVDAAEAGIAGLAIRPGTFGSISGLKWNDLNGDGVKDSNESGLPGWTIYFDDNGNGVLDSSFATTIPSDDVPQDIIDESTVKSELLFQGVREIFDLNVTLDISHAFNADVNVYLVSPSGTRVELFSDIGAHFENFTNTKLDDEASTPITSAAAPFTGTFRPEGSLSTFDGENANGIWILEIADDAAADSGVLNSWSLTISGREQSTTTDGSGNYSFEDLPPGVYSVREVMQPDWKQTLGQPPVTVTSGGRVTGVNFGNQQGQSQPEPGSLAGAVWNDLNGDGIKDGGEPGLPDWTIYVDGNDNGLYDSSALRTVTSTAVPRSIDDFSTVTSEASFSGLNSVTKVTVTLDITHSFDGDLDVYLISPQGTQVELFSAVGGQFNNFTDTSFDQDAAESISDGTAPFTGTFRPEGLLTDFNGENPNGLWRLLIRDTADGDIGTLNSWSLTVSGQELSTTTDANGNYSFDDIVPGSYNLRQVLQAGWVPTHAPTIPIVIGLNQQITDANFGNEEGSITLVGDYNSDLVVDSMDYVVWRRSMNQTVPPFSGADGDGDGHVDQDDYDLWRTNFGRSYGSGGSAASLTIAEAGAVLEPSAGLPIVFTPGFPEVEASQSFAVDAAGEPIVVSGPSSDTESTSADRVTGRSLHHRLLDAGQDTNDAALMAILGTRHINRAESGTSAGTSSPRVSTSVEEDDAFDSLDSAFETLGALALPG
jgi:subtilisin-like proprotein convertase family protein